MAVATSFPVEDRDDERDSVSRFFVCFGDREYQLAVMPVAGDESAGSRFWVDINELPLRPEATLGLSLSVDRSRGADGGRGQAVASAIRVACLLASRADAQGAGEPVEPADAGSAPA